MTEKDLQVVINRELALLSFQVRRSAQQVDELLDPLFREIGASGQLWTRADTISALASERSDSEGAIEATEMAAEPFAVDLVQLIYVSRIGKGDEPGEAHCGGNQQACGAYCSTKAPRSMTGSR